MDTVQRSPAEDLSDGSFMTMAWRVAVNILNKLIRGGPPARNNCLPP
jgi:hypothetical protein